MNTKRPLVVTGAQIAAIRAPYTQDQMAEKLGVSRTTVQNWENERSPIPPAAWLALRQWGLINRLKAELKSVNPEKYKDI